MNKPKIIKAGRGQDGDFAEVHLESGEELLPQETIRQLKLGNIKGDYSQDGYSEKEPPMDENIILGNKVSNNNDYDKLMDELIEEYDEEL